MITVTPSAVAKIQDIVKASEGTPTIRVYVSAMGCEGVTWGLAVDDPQEQDDVCALEGFQVAADRRLLELVGGLTVDFQATSSGAGFRVTPEKMVAKTCGNGRCSC